MTYFKPLRRKLGLLTLVLACVLMCGWMRSVQVTDFLIFPATGNLGTSLLSSRHRLMLCTEYCADPAGIRVAWSAFTRRRFYPIWKCRSRSLEDFTIIHWSINVCGFAISEPRESSGSIGSVPNAITYDFTSQYWSIPYWFIVLPLTLLSAWLLLSNPKQKVLANQHSPAP